MANCIYCSKALSNNKQVAYRCKNCNTVWCLNGNCTGSSGRPQHSRTSKAICMTCKNSGGILKV